MQATLQQPKQEKRQVSPTAIALLALVPAAIIGTFLENPDNGGHHPVWGIWSGLETIVYVGATVWLFAKTRFDSFFKAVLALPFLAAAFLPGSEPDGLAWTFFVTWSAVAGYFFGRHKTNTEYPARQDTFPLGLMYLLIYLGAVFQMDLSKIHEFLLPFLIYGLIMYAAGAITGHIMGGKYGSDD